MQIVDLSHNRLQTKRFPFRKNTQKLKTNEFEFCVVLKIFFQRHAFENLENLLSELLTGFCRN